MTAIARSDDVRRQNRRLVLSVLRRRGRLSRTEICRLTGLSASTVSAITSDLIAEGILREHRDAEATASTRRGRPQVALGLHPAACSVMTVVLSLNALSAALIDYSGQVVREEHRKLGTLTAAREDLIAEMQAMAGRLMNSAEGSSPVLRIAVAIQGITDSAARSLLWSPITPHSDVPVADILEQAFGVPVSVENDCNMIAYALSERDPERYRDNFIAVLLSHGIGMGLVVKGNLFTGTHSSGGEFGHMNHIPDGALCRCGRHGCIEAYAGNYAIWRNARGESEDVAPLADISAAEMAAIAEAARRGPGSERDAFAAAGEAIGFGLGSLFALIDPAPVAIVGQGAAAFDLIEKPMLDAIAKTAGGQHSAALSFETEPNEMPLIRSGCALRALTWADREAFAAAGRSQQPRQVRAVA